MTGQVKCEQAMQKVKCYIVAQVFDIEESIKWHELHMS